MPRTEYALRPALFRLPAAAQSLIQLYQSKILGQNSLIDLHLSIKETTFGIQKVDISYIARDVLQLRQLDILARRLAQITFRLALRYATMASFTSRNAVSTFCS